jgi:hypothetical protein
VDSSTLNYQLRIYLWFVTAFLGFGSESPVGEAIDVTRIGKISMIVTFSAETPEKLSRIDISKLVRIRRRYNR